MIHKKLDDFPKGFYGDQLQQLIKWKVHGIKMEKGSQFGMNL